MIVCSKIASGDIFHVDEVLNIIRGMLCSSSGLCVNYVIINMKFS